MSEAITALGQSPRQSYRPASFPRRRLVASQRRSQAQTRSRARHCLAICVLLATLLGPAAAASAAGGPPSPDRLRGPRTDKPGAFWPANLKLFLVAGLGGAGALAFFGFLYAREWYLNRGFRQYKIGLGASDRIPLPIATSDRTSWFKRGQAAQKASAPPASPPAATTPEPPAPAPEPKPAPRTSLFGVLNVRADDELHEILVDGKFVGMTPARLTLPEGLHRLELRRAGCDHYRREITVIGGAEVSLRPLPTQDGISRQFALS